VRTLGVFLIFFTGVVVFHNSFTSLHHGATCVPDCTKYQSKVREFGAAQKVVGKEL